MKDESRLLEMFRDAMESKREVRQGGHTYRVLIADKPMPNKRYDKSAAGEPKTDVYALLEDETGKHIELKISHKKENADFLENKIMRPRFNEMFGKDADTRMNDIIGEFKDKVARRVVYNYEKGSYCLGYRLDIVNKPAGHLTVEAELSDSQKIDVYSGTNLPESKRNALVGGQEIKDSGVANVMLQHDISDDYTIEDAIGDCQDIRDYAKSTPIYYKLSAVNYCSERERNKFENRALLFSCRHSVGADGKICGIVVPAERPLETKAREFANELFEVAETHGITLRAGSNACRKMPTNASTVEDVSDTKTPSTKTSKPRQKSRRKTKKIGAARHESGDGEVFVEGYTKSNGVVVSSYTRSRGKRR